MYNYQGKTALECSTRRNSPDLNFIMDLVANFILKETRRTVDHQALEAFPAKMRRQGWAVHRGWVSC